MLNSPLSPGGWGAGISIDLMHKDCHLQSSLCASLFCSLTQTIFWKEAEARLVIFVVCGRNGLFVLFVLRPRNCVDCKKAHIFA